MFLHHAKRTFRYCAITPLQECIIRATTDNDTLPIRINELSTRLLLTESLSRLRTGKVWSERLSVFLSIVSFSPRSSLASEQMKIRR